MDFIHDGMAGGKRLRCLTIVDDFTRECLHIEVAPSIPAERVTRVLDYLGWLRDLPDEIVRDRVSRERQRRIDRGLHSARRASEVVRIRSHGNEVGRSAGWTIQAEISHG